MRCTVWKNSLALILCACLLILSGCGTNDKKTVRFFSMDTLMEISAYGDADTALQRARETIESLDVLLNASDPQSAVSCIKNGDILQKNILLPLQTAQTIAGKTNGALDLTLFPISQAWGFYSKEYRVPTAEELQELLLRRGSFSVRDGKYTCADGTKLDLGSIAKGYAGACAAETLRENGVRSAVLSLGGNVQTVGKKPDGSDRIVSVADPLAPDGTVCNLRVGETAVVTSGSYQRNFTQNGKTYHHILDPETGKPAESGLLSVTVVCADGTLADGLSTALFILGEQGIKELYARHVFSFEAIIITDAHELFYTEGLADRLEITNETYAHSSPLQ